MPTCKCPNQSFQGTLRDEAAQRPLNSNVRHSMRALSIPTEKDWVGYQNDFDAVDFHAIAFGKSNEELQEYFGKRGTLRFDELLRLPRPVFQYYIFGFAQLVTSPTAKGDSDSASIFLALLETREEEDPGCVRQIYGDLSRTIAFIAANQEYFDASVDIYGSFSERAKKIESVCYA
jgi:hypothetical protein